MARVEQNVLSVEAVDKLPIIWAKVKKAKPNWLETGRNLVWTMMGLGACISAYKGNRYSGWYLKRKSCSLMNEDWRIPRSSDGEMCRKDCQILSTINGLNRFLQSKWGISLLHALHGSVLVHLQVQASHGVYTYMHSVSVNMPLHPISHMDLPATSEQLSTSTQNGPFPLVRSQPVATRELQLMLVLMQH